jgi:tetratricopeptide (TPR) repeat protein
MMPALEQLLAAGQPPPVANQRSKGETALREIVNQLAEHPDTAYGSDSDMLELLDADVDEPIFETYYRAAVRVVRDEDLGPEEFARVLLDATGIGGDGGEYALDLLRRVSAEYTDDIALQKRATEEHLKILVEGSHSVRHQSRRNDDIEMDRARRFARCGLRIIDSVTGFTVDPNVHAEMLLAMGQTYARVENLGDPQLAETLTYYLQALDLKEEAENWDDVQRLKDLLRGIIEYLIPMAHLSAVVGLGKTLRGLELAYKATLRIDDTWLTCQMARTLSNIYSTVRQPELADEILREVLSRDDLEENDRDELNSALASSLSERHLGREAAEIQAALIGKKSKILDEPIGKTTLYMNYGNSLRVDGDIDGAHNAFETALASAPAIENENERKNITARLHALTGEIRFLKGDPKRGEEELKKAESMFTVDLSGTDRIHFNNLAGRCYFDAGHYDEALRHLNASREALRGQLERGPWPSVWESMLNAWSNLDAMVIQIYLSKGGAENTESALVASEAAKGRLLRWLSMSYLEEAPGIALSPERHEAALKAVREWTAANSRRTVVSFFANVEGLGLFYLKGTEPVSGTWLGEFEYDSFMTDFYEPWEKLIDTALTSDSELWGVAGALTDLMLDRIGEWIWRACPQLAEGGEELVLIPHRLFRSLPLSHCRLPGGKRLSECFDRVTVSSSLYDLSRSISREDDLLDTDGSRVALVDPDNTLPFARLEGLLFAGPDASLSGTEVTVESIHQTLHGSDVALISCHGDFDEKNPWQSGINVADGDFKVYEILDPQYRVVTDLVVLGACEAARTRRSLSDEPFGFPGMLVQAGVGAVLAPLWKVDDYSTLLYLTHFFETIDAGANPVAAAQSAAHWLRDLSRKDAMELTDGLLERAESLMGGSDKPEGLDQISERLTAIRDWIQTLDKDERPFRSPLDWAAFQFVGHIGVKPS